MSQEWEAEMDTILEGTRFALTLKEPLWLQDHQCLVRLSSTGHPASVDRHLEVDNGMSPVCWHERWCLRQSI